MALRETSHGNSSSTWLAKKSSRMPDTDGRLSRLGVMKLTMRVATGLQSDVRRIKQSAGLEPPVAIRSPHGFNAMQWIPHSPHPCTFRPNDRGGAGGIGMFRYCSFLWCEISSRSNLLHFDPTKTWLLSIHCCSQHSKYRIKVSTSRFS